MPRKKRNPNDACLLRSIARRRHGRPFTQRWSVWAAGYGGSQTTDGNAALGSNNTTSRITGGVVGADYRFSPFTLAGFALAGGGTNFSVRTAWLRPLRPVSGRRLYPSHRRSGLLSGALAYGWQDITTDRTVTVAGIDQLRAQFNANAWSGRVEGGYRFVSPWMGMGMTPYAAGQFTTFDLPAYAEQAHRRRQYVRARLRRQERHGLAQRTRLAQRQIIRDAGWHLHPARTCGLGARFQHRPGYRCDVPDAAGRILHRQWRGTGTIAALVTASAEMKWLNGWSAAATFEGEFSSVTTSYAGKGVVRYSW